MAGPPPPGIPAMEAFCVLLSNPMDAYLEGELARRFTLLRPWESPPQRRGEFLRSNSGRIRAVVVNGVVGADAQTIELLPRVEIIESRSAGVDKVDLGKCREKGIRVTNTPGVHAGDVADIAIGLAIAVLRRICAADRHVRSGAWVRKGDFRLTARFSGKSVGIMGLGRIGLAIAKRAEAFGCPISYHSRSEKPNTQDYRYFPSVPDLAAHCEILMVACPLTADTHHIINREVIEALGAKGILVNVSRGSLVDEPELVSALLKGRLGGAGLDVYEHEPEPPAQLFQLDNVVVLPHVGARTRAALRAMSDLMIANLEAHVLNEPLLTPVL